jgi:hypothetical protein
LKRNSESKKKIWGGMRRYRSHFPRKASLFNNPPCKWQNGEENKNQKEQINQMEKKERASKIRMIL